MSLDTPSLFSDSSNNEVINIDNVFENITKLYDKRLLKIIHNLLLLFKEEQNEENRLLYLDGLTQILTPLNKQIKSWIHENLTC